MRKKILLVFGTRPEAIKMAPLIIEFKKNDSFFDTKVCVTAQHREMLDQVLDFFEISPDYDLNLMKQNQDLYTLTSDILLGLKEVLYDFKPDFVFVHGDTSTSSAAALASFYNRSKVCHVEAGLRTHNKWSPFPEEINRQITGRIADFHFAPTILSKTNLLNENISDDAILVTGNTVIDALLYSSKKVENYESDEINFIKGKLNLTKKIILVTGHRRENHGEGFIRICNAIKKIAIQNDDVEIIYPVHLNPNVKDPVLKFLSELKNVYLVHPLSYPTFVWLMKISKLIITDSGGVQEEAPSLGKHVLVMRDTTERPEALESGKVLLVGTNEAKIVEECNRILAIKFEQSENNYNPYGDGFASKKIVDFLKKLNYE